MTNKLVKNLINSLAGLKVAVSDTSFRTEIYLGIALVPILIVFESDNLGHKFAILENYLLLLAFELINTSIERLSDRVCMEYDLSIKKVKDMASAGVFLVLTILIFNVVTFLYPFICGD